MMIYNKHITTFTVAKALTIVCMVFICLPGSNVFGTETAGQISKRLQNYYQDINSLSFSFIQTTKGQMIGRPKIGKGKGLFARTQNGAKMRWDYNSPDRQTLISDGQQLSMYFEKLNQMIITPVNKNQADILFSFFAGRGTLEDSFTILDSDPVTRDTIEDSNSTLSVIHLIPKSSESQFDTIHLYVTEDSLIRRVELIDHFETSTTINISNISVNPLQSLTESDDIEKLFSFTPPQGTEIIRQ